jgi:hypothetical protein
MTDALALQVQHLRARHGSLRVLKEQPMPFVASFE